MIQGGNYTTATLGVIDDVYRYGNITPYAEFNVWADPEAGAAIFNHPVLSKKAVLIPLDVTHQVLATNKVQQLILHGPSGSIEKPSTLRIMLVELLYFFASTYSSKFGLTEGPPLHDPLAVAVALDGITGVEIPFFDYQAKDGEREIERYQVEVIVDGTHVNSVAGETEMGRTVATLLAKGEEGVKIPRGLDVERFWTVLEECLKAADDTNRGGNKKATELALP